MPKKITKVEKFEMIKFDDLKIGQKLGSGAFGSVFCANYQGTKIANEEDFFLIPRLLNGFGIRVLVLQWFKKRIKEYLIVIKFDGIRKPRKSKCIS